MPAFEADTVIGAAGFAMEVVCGDASRDTPTLDVLMPSDTFPAIKTWPAGG
ncbi:hypothetical protein G3T14_06115 [Methylobacterium sp. BTF04]|nr:hypothetical protein [Methylobacterium sp. BTF04]